uniref:MFS transporter n=1 Tax=candidate division WOR-3 bacterium TaxID=2052148 RepID=A0A7C3UNI4_UNCW3
MFNVIILGIASFLTDVSTEMVYPLLPLYLTLRLGAGPAILGLIEGVAESLTSILKVFSGYLSDISGRRKPITILGYFFSVLGKFFIYLSRVWGLVFLGRVLDRFGKGIRTAPRDALIADSVSEKRGKAYGLHRMLDTFGAVLGVILAIYFLKRFKESFARVFLLSLIPAILGAFILFLIREKGKKDGGGKRRLSLLRDWRNLPKRFKLFLLILFLFSLGNSSNQFLILRANNLGLGMTGSLSLYLFYNLIYGLFSYPAGRLSDWVGRKLLIVIGYLIYGVVYLGFGLISQPSALIFLFGLYGLYSALTEGVEKAFVSDIAPETIRGSLIGLHATLTGIGLLPASLIFGLLWSIFGFRVPFFFGGIMGILASISLALFT